MITDAVNSVLYNIDQREDTTAAEKKTARDNIGAVSADDVGEIVGNYKTLQVPIEITYPDYAILKKLTQNTNGVVGIECSYIHCATQDTNGLLSATDKTKLDGIQAGAEVNVQSDWSQSDSGADDFIKNKPSIPSVQKKAYGGSPEAVSTLLIDADDPDGFVGLKADNAYMGDLVNGPYKMLLDSGVNGAGDSSTPVYINGNGQFATCSIPTVFIATYNSTTYQQVSDALTAGKAVFLNYSNAFIPLASSTASRHGFLQMHRDAHSYAQQTDYTRAFVLNSDNTWEMNTVPVAYNILAGTGLTYMINGNDLTLSVSSSVIRDLKYLESQTVSVTQDMTLNIADGYAYVLSLAGSGSPMITLATNSTTTLHSLIAVKSASSTSCSDVTIRYYDETNMYHDVIIQMNETTNEYDFYVDIRKVTTTGQNTASIARLYDMPCMWRNGSSGRPQYQSDTAWIGLLS